MYQPSASGSASSRSVSAVGAQSTTTTSHSPLTRVVAQLEQRQHLLGAGDDGQLLGRDRVDPGGVEHRQQVALDLAPGPLEAALGVDLVHPQAVGRPRSARGPTGSPKASPSECAASVESTSVRCPRAGGERGRAGGGGGLADPALAGEQDDAHAHGRLPRAQPSDSTRFFRPLSAVSMMTFSALRRSMPIIGMLRSTASR